MTDMPKPVSDTEVRILLDEFFGDEPPKNKGTAMKLIRDEYGTDVDVKRAGEIITEMFGV